MYLINFLNQLIGVSTAVGALSTLILVIVGLFQLRSIRKTSNADFIHRLRDDFFTDKARYFIELIDKKLITFSIKSNEPKFLKIDEINSEPYDEISVYEIDDFILGPLEDVATYEYEGIIKLGMIYSIFSWYIEIVWKNESIQEYIKWQRKQKNCEDINLGLERLYNKCIRYKKYC